MATALTRSDAVPSALVTASCASPVVSFLRDSVGPSVGSKMRRTLDLLAVRVRPKAAISSASTKPMGPTATLRPTALVRCDHAAKPSPHDEISAAATMNHRQPLFPFSL